MFAAAHGQNSDRVRPVRSDSAMTLIPFASTPPAAVGGAVSRSKLVAIR
jgi:hypothetical protein